jgi:proteasome lid subunit RPN8/RPN11
MGTLSLRRSDLQAIAGHARRALPREACGLLLGHGDAQAGFTVTRIVESENVAPPARHDRFEIDPKLLLSLHRGLREAASGAGAPACAAEGTCAASASAKDAVRILGVYHSHPGGAAEPSPTDRARAAEPGLVWLIAALDPSGARADQVDARAFLHTEGLEPARFVPLSLIIDDG